MATAQNFDCSALQQTEDQELSTGVVRVVQVTPVGLVITLFPVPEYATAQNNPVVFAVGDHATLIQLLSAADVWINHVIPSVLVMTLLPVPEVATAQNLDCSALQQTEDQELSAAEVRVDQVTPVGLVMTLLPVPELATAQNKPVVLAVGLQHTSDQLLSAADV